MVVAVVVVVVVVVLASLLWSGVYAQLTQKSITSKKEMILKIFFFISRSSSKHILNFWGLLYSIFYHSLKNFSSFLNNLDKCARNILFVVTKRPIAHKLYK